MFSHRCLKKFRWKLSLELSKRRVSVFPFLRSCPTLQLNWIPFVTSLWLTVARRWFLRLFPTKMNNTHSHWHVSCQSVFLYHLSIHTIFSLSHGGLTKADLVNNPGTNSKAVIQVVDHGETLGHGNKIVFHLMLIPYIFIHNYSWRLIWIHFEFIGKPIELIVS